MLSPTDILITYNLKSQMNLDEHLYNEIDFGLKPKAGSIIIFPSMAPYHHTAHIVKNGFKYMVPSHWIHNDMSLHQGHM